MKIMLNKFRIFMFLYWAMMVSFLGMYVMYITHLGFKKIEVSAAVVTLMLSALLGQCAIGYLVDKLKCLKKIMMLSISVGLIVAVALFFAKLHWHYYVIIFAWGFFVYGTMPISEAWCIENLKVFNEQRNFGKVRGLGSIGCGISAAFLGVLIQNFGWKIYYGYMFTSVLLTLASIYVIKTTTLETNEVEKMSKVGNKLSFKEALKEIIKIKPLKNIVITVFMYIFVVRGIYSYLGVLVSDFGGGPLSIGFTYFFDATPEVITFFIAGRLLKKFGARKLIFAAFLIQIIRLSLIAIFKTTLAVILVGPLSGVAFGLLAASYKTYMYDLVPERFKVSCMSVCESIIGLAIVISAPVFGFLFTRVGTTNTILIALVIYIIVVFVMSKDFYKNKIQKINAA